MTRTNENLDCVGGAPIVETVEKVVYDDAIAALEGIAELDGKTLLTDPGYDRAVQMSYSLGAARAFAQAAAIAKSVLSQKEGG